MRKRKYRQKGGKNRTMTKGKNKLASPSLTGHHKSASCALRKKISAKPRPYIGVFCNFITISPYKVRTRQSNHG